MKKIYILIAWVTVCCLSSCLDDKTNLDYSPALLPDSIFVTNLKDGVRAHFKTGGKVINKTYRLAPGEYLQLEADAIYRGDDEITYEWHLDDKIISTEKTVNYLCGEVTPAGKGNAMLLAYRKKAGNAVCCAFEVSVTPAYSAGIAVVAEDQGSIKFDFIERTIEDNVKVNIEGTDYNLLYFYQYKLFSDLYARCNDGESLSVEKPVKLSQYKGQGDIGIQILGQDWQNSVTLNYSTMKKIVAMKDEFIIEPQNFRAKDFAAVGVMNFVLGESGQIFSRVNYDNGNPCTGKYSTLPLTYMDRNGSVVEVKGDRLFPIIEGYNNRMLIYEKENKRFLLLSANDPWYIMGGIDYYQLWWDLDLEVSDAMLKDGYTRLDKVDKELITVLGPVNGNVVFLFKDGEDYYIQTNTISVAPWSVPFTMSYSAVKCIKVSPNVAGLLAQAGYSFDIRSGNMISFSSGNTFYLLDPNDGEKVTKVFEFPQKDKITYSCVTSVWYSPTASLANRVYNGKVFCAAFENGDFKVVQLCADPKNPDKEVYRFLVDTHYDGGVKNVLFYY